jgi:hypothetical protein
MGSARMLAAVVTSPSFDGVDAMVHRALGGQWPSKAENLADSTNIL